MLTITTQALVELVGEDNVFVISTELADEALGLAELWENDKRRITNLDDEISIPRFRRLEKRKVM